MSLDTPSAALSKGGGESIKIQPLLHKKQRVRRLRFSNLRDAGPTLKPRPHQLPGSKTRRFTSLPFF